MSKRRLFSTLIIVIILVIIGFSLFTRPLISYQQALQIASQKVMNSESGSHINFDEVWRAWYNDGRLFDPHHVYIVTGEDDSKTTVSYVQAVVDARTGKVIAIYNIDYPYQAMFSGTSVRNAEQSAEQFYKPPR